MSSELLWFPRDTSFLGRASTLGKLRNLEKLNKIQTHKHFSELKAFQLSLWLLRHRFWEYLTCMCCFIYSNLSLSSSPCHTQVRLGGWGVVTSILHTVKLRRRGEITFLRPCRRFLLGIRLVMVSGPVHNLRQFLSPSLSQGWVIFSAEAAHIGSSSWAAFLWPLPWHFFKEFWLISVLGDIFIADERISNVKAGAGKHRF